jgi:uncharacterized protein YegL
MMRLLSLAALVVCMNQYTTAELDLKTCKMDVVFTLDNTGSIAVKEDGYTLDTARPPTNWKLITGFTQNMIKQINTSPEGSHVGLVDFGAKARIQSGLIDSEADILAKAGGIPFKGDTTNTTDALYKSRQVLTDPKYGLRAGLPKIVVLITDGNPNKEELAGEGRVYTEAQACRDAGIRVIVVGVTPAANDEIMQRLSYQTDDYVKVEDFRDLDAVKNKILTEEACEPVPTTTTTTTTPEPTTTTPESTTPEPTTPEPTTPEPTTPERTTPEPTTAAPTTAAPTTSAPEPPPPTKKPLLPECDYPHLIIF